LKEAQVPGKAVKVILGPWKSVLGVWRGAWASRVILAGRTLVFPEGFDLREPPRAGGRVEQTHS